MTKGFTTHLQHVTTYRYFITGVLVVLFLLVITLLVSFAPVNAGPPPPAGPAASTFTATAPFTATDKLALFTTIHPMYGGELSESDGSVHVIFPAGAVSNTQLATLTLGTAGALPRRLNLAGPAFQLETDKLGEQETTRAFTITLRYTFTQDAEDIVVAWWDSRGWRLLPTQVDTTMRTATALGTRFTVYALVLLGPSRVLPQRAIVVDDMSAGFAPLGDSRYWYTATLADGAYAGQTHWTYSSIATRTNWATWTSPVSLNGNYLVVAFIPSDHTDTQQAQYQVHHNGKVDSVVIAQAQHRNDWAILGLFDFTSGTESYIWLSDVTGEKELPIAFDAIAFISANVGPPSGGIVVDDADAGFAALGNVTYWYTAPPPSAIYYANQTRWTLNNSSTLQNWATWTPATLLDGNYQVWAFVPSYHSDTQHARYQVHHNNQTSTVEISQSPYLGDWVSLGVFDFTDVTSGYVLLSDVTGEPDLSRHIAFDAIAFTPNNLYLPVVLKNYPPPPPMKEWSGMHLGNRGADWTQEMLEPFDPQQGGIWPHVAVVLSDQVYTLIRDGNCRITGVQVKHGTLYNYLRRAAQEGGAQIIVRINPSPGNFEESINDKWPDLATRPAGRTLIAETDTRPGGWSQCNNEWRFRPVDDIGDEIIEIQRSSSWIWGFEPANEPNIEWYWNDQGPRPVPSYLESKSWSDMDLYFANLYNYVHNNAGGLSIRVLTPPMAQAAMAETHHVNSSDPGCGSAYPFSGYAVMASVVDSTAPKNDGYSWHNYWVYGRESWEACPNGQHVSMWFPSSMSQNLSKGTRPGVITEADLYSPMKWDGNLLITDKDTVIVSTTLSLNGFLRVEHDAHMGQSVAVWLLNDNTGTAEHMWHQAYTSTVGFRQWFTEWWFNPEK